jgi:hypothetical protein
MPIPELDPATGYLPPGDHEATLCEIEHTFGSASYRRRQIMGGVKFVVVKLRQNAVRTIWVNGSFVTAEVRPRDADVLYVPPPGADLTTWGILAPLRRRDLKLQHRVDLLAEPATGRAGLHDFFSTDRDDIPKGLILLAEDSP